MSTYSEITEGFAIFAKYGDDGSNFEAGHDVIYAGPYDTSAVSAEDLAKLNALGWRKDTENGGGFCKFV